MGDKTWFPLLATVNSVKFNYFSNLSSIRNNINHEEFAFYQVSSYVLVI